MIVYLHESYYSFAEISFAYDKQTYQKVMMHFLPFFVCQKHPVLEDYDFCCLHNQKIISFFVVVVFV